MNSRRRVSEDESLTKGENLLLERYFLAKDKKKHKTEGGDPEIEKFFKSFDLKCLSQKELRKSDKKSIFRVDHRIPEQYFECLEKLRELAERSPLDRGTVLMVLPHYIKLIPRLTHQVKVSIEMAKKGQPRLLSGNFLCQVAELFCHPSIGDDYPDRIIILEDLLQSMLNFWREKDHWNRSEFAAFREITAKIGVVMLKHFDKVVCEHRFWILWFVCELLLQALQVTVDSVSGAELPVYKQLKLEFLAVISPPKTTAATFTDMDESIYRKVWECLAKLMSVNNMTTNEFDWMASVHLCMSAVKNFLPLKVDELGEIGEFSESFLCATEKIISMNVKKPFTVVRWPPDKQISTNMPEMEVAKISPSVPLDDQRSLVDVWIHLGSFHDILTKDDGKLRRDVLLKLDQKLQKEDCPLVREFILATLKRMEPEDALEVLRNDGKSVWGCFFKEDYVPFLYFSVQEQSWAQSDAIFQGFVLLDQLGNRISESTDKSLVDIFEQCLTSTNSWVRASMLCLMNACRPETCDRLTSKTVIDKLTNGSEGEIEARTRKPMCKFLATYLPREAGRKVLAEPYTKHVFSCIINPETKNLFIGAFNEILKAGKADICEYFGRLGVFISEKSEKIECEFSIGAICGALDCVATIANVVDQMDNKPDVNDKRLLESLGNFGKGVVAFFSKKPFENINEHCNASFSEEQHRLLHMVARAVLLVLFQLSRVSNKIHELLTDPSCKAVPSLAVFMHFVRWESSLIDSLLSLALRRQITLESIRKDERSPRQLVSSAGVRLLNVYALSSGHYEEIANILYNMVKGSLSNRYICFLGGTIEYLFQYLVNSDEDNDNVRRLFLAIGNSFFHKKETLMSLHVIQTMKDTKSDQKCWRLTKMLEMILKLEALDDTEKSGLFHLWSYCEQSPDQPSFRVKDLALPLKINFLFRMDEGVDLREAKDLLTLNFAAKKGC